MIVCSFSILYFCSPSFGGHAAVGVSAACSCYTPTMSSLAPYSQDRHTHALLHTPQVFHSSCRTRTHSASNSDCRRCCRFSLKRITFHSSFDFFFSQVSVEEKVRFHILSQSFCFIGGRGFCSQMLPIFFGFCRETVQSPL